LLRIWFGFSFRCIRLLNSDKLPEGAVILAANHPAGFIESLVLLSAFDRQIVCLINSNCLRGRFARRTAQYLRMIPYDVEGEAWQGATAAAAEALRAGTAVMLFAEPRVRTKSGVSWSAWTASHIAQQAESAERPVQEVSIAPVHLLLPVAPSRSSELLIVPGPPVSARTYLSGAGPDSLTSMRALGAAIDRQAEGGPFRLPRESLQQLLAGIEEVAKADLQRKWSSRPDWKQDVTEFRLSQFVHDMVEQLNSLHPGRLIALGDLLNRYQRARQQWSLQRIEIETSAQWQNSFIRRLAVWLEAALGLPIAVYGLINHIVVALALFATGLMKDAPPGKQGKVWFWRAIAVMICYALEVRVFSLFFSRAITGYYAASLPFSGLYLWRFHWLLRNRVQYLYRETHRQQPAGRLLRLKRQLQRNIREASNTYADLIGVLR
jgi:hypothetical protein